MAVLEIGIYKIHAGKRDEFVKLYDEELLPAQRDFGFDVVGHFVSLDDEQTFVWLRRFSSREERQRMTDEYYGGDLWWNELAPRALPLIEDYSNVIAVEPAPASAIQ